MRMRHGETLPFLEDARRRWWTMAAPELYQQASSSAGAAERAVEFREARPVRRAGWAACAAALCVAGVVVSGVDPRGAALVGPELDMITGAQRMDWSVYKFTIPVGNASLAPLKELASSIFGPATVSDLGCGGLKLSVGTTASAGARLHFVQSAILSNDPTPIDVWERYWEALNGDMSAFNAFMHSKATLFTTEFAKVLATIEGLGLPVLRLVRDASRCIWSVYSRCKNNIKQHQHQIAR